MSRPDALQKVAKPYSNQIITSWPHTVRRYAPKLYKDTSVTMPRHDAATKSADHCRPLCGRHNPRVLRWPYCQFVSASLHAKTKVFFSSKITGMFGFKLTPGRRQKQTKRNRRLQRQSGFVLLELVMISNTKGFCCILLAHRNTATHHEGCTHFFQDHFRRFQHV